MNYKLTETSNNYTVYNWHAGKLVSKAPIKIYQKQHCQATFREVKTSFKLGESFTFTSDMTIQIPPGKPF